MFDSWVPPAGSQHSRKSQDCNWKSLNVDLLDIYDLKWIEKDIFFINLLFCSIITNDNLLDFQGFVSLTELTLIILHHFDRRRIQMTMTYSFGKTWHFIGYICFIGSFPALSGLLPLTKIFTVILFQSYRYI